ncbi:MAG: xanthine dehydrogenase accessory protein XdhC [Firmicutes bacterium]|nr:xanthine dehydrogenase accessory protein XdhC [Bacillota bacterium]
MDTTWIETLARLKAAGEPLVVVTLTAAKGHAPQEAGAKMLVTREAVYGTVGGGNLEQAAVVEARALLGAGGSEPRTLALNLGPEAGEWGLQCCGGRVELLLEPVRFEQPQVAIFGLGHVGWALARILRLFPLDLVLVDHRAPLLAPARLAGLGEGPARVRPRLAEDLAQAVGGLPAGAAVVIMTHDHAWDRAILEAALDHGRLGFIGLIGSAAKWARFRRGLLEAGRPPEAVDRIHCPVGLPGIRGREPARIALSAAAELIPALLPGPQDVRHAELYQENSPDLAGDIAEIPRNQADC